MAKIRINPNDIVGRKFGRLKVMDYVGYNRKTTKGGPRVRHYYYCSCECGGYNIIQRGCLLNQNIRSCGCLKKERRNGFK